MNKNLIHIPAEHVTETERWINPASITEARWIPGNENEEDEIILWFQRDDFRLSLFGVQANQFRDKLNSLSE